MNIVIVGWFLLLDNCGATARKNIRKASNTLIEKKRPIVLFLVLTPISLLNGEA